MNLLAGRTALVTGGANGIGRAIVQGFGREGARVALVDRDPAPELPTNVAAFAFDLSETERLEGLVREVEKAVGPLDVFVNNAGIFEPGGGRELPLDVSRRVRAVDLD